jgi:glycosyltransferase involved in cell wall biosynthesis
MVDLLNDAASRRRMGEAARERVVLEFGTERLVRDHVDLYRRLVGLPA